VTYDLGIDLGTTYTAAAVRRNDRVEIATLGNRAAAVPSVVFLREDETILTGEAANRRALAEPDRVAREFKRRVGDPTPLMLGGTPYSAQSLMAKLLHWVMGAVAEREGGPASHVAVTHPANWGPYKKGLLEEALRLADLHDVTTLTEPEAAATYYASTERVEPGAIIAVYDLGGGTFDAAILKKTETGFEILGTPEGIEHMGGIDFDQAVFAHVNRSLDGALEELDPSDPSAIKAVARLRADCIEAKEALSSDTDTSIPVMLPSLQTEVRLTRGQFENMIRPALSETIEALRRALRTAQVEPEDVTSVLLVGGSSRIPMVAQMVSAELGRPVAVDAHPKHSIALGAAIAAGAAAAAGTVAETAATAVIAALPSEPVAAQLGPQAPLPADAPQGVIAPVAEPVLTSASVATAPPAAAPPVAAPPAPAAVAPATEAPGETPAGPLETVTIPPLPDTEAAPPIEKGEGPPPPPPIAPRPSRTGGRRVVAIAAALVLVVGGAATALVLNRGTGTPSAGPSPSLSLSPSAPSPSANQASPSAGPNANPAIVPGSVTSSCVNGYLVPLRNTSLRFEPLNVIRDTQGVEGLFVIAEMRFFQGPDNPNVTPQESTVLRWYVKAFLQNDPSFRGRWLIEKRSVGEGVVAVAPYDTKGFHSSDWVGFEGEGNPQQYSGLPGLWAGVPYDYVNSGDLPPQVAGCLAGT
jgi:molecular chaperone DnaK